MNRNSVFLYYKDTAIEGIDPSLNYSIDDIELFLNLSGAEILSFENLQPFDLVESLALVLPMSEKFSGSKVPQYAKITHSTEEGDETYYYFVDRIERSSNKACRVLLSIDYLNSFHDEIKKGMLSKTHVIREHKDRFSVFSKDFTGRTEAVVNVDDYSEGILCEQFKNASYKIVDETLSSTNWFLAYQSLTAEERSSTPIKVSLIPSDSIKFRTTGSGSARDVRDNWFRSPWHNETIYMIPQFSGLFSLEMRGATGNGEETLTLTNSNYPNGFVLVCDRRLTAVDYSFSIHPIQSITNGMIVFGTTIAIAKVNQVICAKGLEVKRQRINEGSSPLTSMADIIELENVSVNIGDGSTADSKTIDDFPRTSSTLLKLIELPYLPLKINLRSDGTYSLPNGFSFEYPTGYIVSNPLFDFSKRDFQIDLIDELEMFLGVVSKSDLRKINDPKTLHSDFHTEKVAFDSFSYEIKLEKLRYLNLDVPSSVFAEISYKQSNMISSSFAVRFDGVKTSSSETLPSFSYFDSFDYPVFVSARSLESPIFNSAYLEYINNGYNFDKKSLARNEFTTAVKFVGSTANAVASGGAIGGAVQSVSSLVNAVASIEAQKDSIEEKRATLGAQQANVSGADDLSLLKFYNGNKIQRIVYEVPPIIKSWLNQLFHYKGYSTNEYKQPNLDSRTWFNYIECDPVFDLKNYPLPKWAIDPLEAKFRQGVTFFHKNDDAEIKYDFSQSRENWEVKLL